MHILFKYTWIILQDRSHARPQKPFKKYKGIEIILSIFSNQNNMKLASLVTQTVMSLPAMWETCVQSLGWEDVQEKEMATHSSILA